MISIDIETLLTILYVLIDDCYKAKGHLLLVRKAGAKPIFTDSEVLTLMVALGFMPYGSEGRYIGYMCANYGDLFPDLLDQSQYNRGARNLWRLVEAVCQEWVCALGADLDKQLLLDTKLIPVGGYTRSKRHSDFSGSASYGYCAVKQIALLWFQISRLDDLSGSATSLRLGSG